MSLVPRLTVHANPVGPSLNWEPTLQMSVNKANRKATSCPFLARRGWNRAGPQLKREDMLPPATHAGYSGAGRRTVGVLLLVPRMVTRISQDRGHVQLTQAAPQMTWAFSFLLRAAESLQSAADTQVSQQIQLIFELQGSERRRFTCTWVFFNNYS